MNDLIPSDQALPLLSLVTPTEGGISSRVLARTAGGSLTLFAFDEGQGLREHRSPHEALAVVNEGIVMFTVGPAKVRATPGTIVHMPANVPHDLEAIKAARVLLVMLRRKTT